MKKKFVKPEIIAKDIYNMRKVHAQEGTCVMTGSTYANPTGCTLTVNPS